MSFILLADDEPKLAITGAWATTTNTIRVLLSLEPMNADAYTVGDALNPLTWQVTRGDTDASLTVIGAVMFDTTTVDLTLLEALPDHLTAVTVATSTLLSLTGDPDPSSFTFPGVVQTLDPVDAVTIGAFRDRDLANPPFPSNLGLAGSLTIGTSGDYENEAGKPLVRKLVVRRLGTRRGAFRHLPTYGLGIIEKNPIPSGGDLQAIRKDIESQVQEEPDVDTCRARLLLDRSNVLVVQLSIAVKGGMTLNLRMGNSGGRLVEV